MKIHKKLTLSIAISAFTLTGCQSILSSEPTPYKAMITYDFAPLELDNRFPNKRSLSEKISRTSSFSDDGLLTSSEIKFKPSHIIRCDEPVTECRHGIINPIIKIEYNKEEISNGKIIVSGKYIFEISKSVKRKSQISSTTTTIPEGFPLLPQETIIIPFTGMTGDGEVITVSGPYESSFSLSVSLKNKA